ncbi:Multidrug resistance-associated protein 1, partial [Dinochytrium kinnereticum]
ILLLTSGGLKASRRLHDGAMAGLIRAPMSFFDSQPIGRILNRMSVDVEGVDLELWNTFLVLMTNSSAFLSSVCAMIYSTPWVLLFLVVVVMLNGLFMRLYRSSMRELKRIIAVERSPLNAHVSECLSGVPVLR